MNTRVRTASQAMKAPPSSEKEKGKTMTQPDARTMDAGKAPGRGRSRRERKIQLQQAVDRLKKKLRREENIHRALERAFTRPSAPSLTLELLAEVAVLEEEVVRLEEQVVSFRQGLYQEAIYFSSSTKKPPTAGNSPPPVPPLAARKAPAGKGEPALHSLLHEEGLKSPDQRKNRELELLGQQAATAAAGGGGSPNRVSEELVRCLMGIFSARRSSCLNSSSAVAAMEAAEAAPSVSGSSDSPDEGIFRDPYGIFSEFGRRDVGPYERFLSLDARWPSGSRLGAAASPSLFRRLRLLLRKLGSVDLRGLTHPEKLAFWVNVYNSCMMNAFLENDIPSTPQMVVTLMQKATINVGGRQLSAISIEHFVLRLPYHSRSKNKKVKQVKERSLRRVLAGLLSQIGQLEGRCSHAEYRGLDWPEPLVTFALSCGSWSSPAVRVYTASKVEDELEVAKRDYLQAALLDWYLLDFAKDVDSLMDWVCLQLPSGLRNDAVNCLETGRSGRAAVDLIRVIPYDFTFRYLLAT
ncbi:unnamed protein product [Spirodela intermedia]|uniref:Uncharacterized protein n=1 Tax=Spirodela intermedia TaxID=51605 RepID=A0A7I8IR88_SPIIN|nr:unnamed protein product [Spirodela intermedia]CAA6659461.1 unnamed protein product [Spirodela intermedia]